MIKLDIAVSYQGGIADDHELDLYDAADSLRGLARSLILPAHFLANGYVIHQAPSAQNVTARLHASRRGSFETIVSLLLDPENGPLAGMATALGTSVANEFLKHLFNRVLGKEEKPTISQTKSIVENSGPTIDALGDAIENDIVNVHRPIITGSNNIIIIGNGNKLATMNRRTLEYARTIITDDDETKIVGRVSAFNANSQRGRIYDSNLRRVIPFRPNEEFSDMEAQIIAWSLSQYVANQPGNIELTVRAIRSVGETVKRYQVINVSKLKRSG